MIIDAHQHVVSTVHLEGYKGGLLSSRGAHGKGGPGITLDMMKAARWQGGRTHLEILDEVGTDMALISARPYTLMHSEKPHIIVHWFAEATNDVIALGVKVDPTRFQGVATLPQCYGVSPSDCIEELERCVNELGFVGCLINPDPGEGEGYVPPMGDEYWYPLYEKMVELNIPGLVHSASCKNPRLTYSVHFINEETINVVSLANSRVFEDFPSLKLIVSHGGGAVPYQIARWRAGRFNAMARGGGNVESFDESIRKLYYDTGVYNKESLELLFKIVGTDRCLFGTENPGTGTAIDPATGKYMDDLKPVIESIEWLSEDDKRKIFEQNARDIFPRLKVGAGQPA
jgi:4-oxalmesaconate hydratase